MRPICLLFFFLFSQISYAQKAAPSNLQVDGVSRAKSFSIAKVFVPPYLEVVEGSVKFIDPNQRLDANETAYLEFSLRNSGKGDGVGLRFKRELDGALQGIALKEIALDDVAAGETNDIRIPIVSNMNVETGELKIKFHIEEPNQLGTEPIDIRLSTLAFQAPDIQIVDAIFKGVNNSKVLELRKTYTLVVSVQNLGQGPGDNIKLDVYKPNQQVIFTEGQGTNPFQINLGHLEPNESVTHSVEFLLTGAFSENSVKFKTKVDESYHTYGSEKTFSKELNSSVNQVEIAISGERFERKEIERRSLTSSVDKDIPVRKDKAPNRFAIVIGNEDYQSKQSGLSSEQNVDYASNDATIFEKYAKMTLGIPDENIHLLINATAGQMNQEFELMKKRIYLLSKSNVESELFIYYAGHGYPDELSKTPYLIPVDISASNLSGAIKLDDLYSKYASISSNKTIFFLDACFTGGGRTAGLLASRGVQVKPKASSLSGNILVFSASSSSESALPYHKEHHGMFTFYLLQKLQDTGGNISMKELGEHLKFYVAEKSFIENRKEQNPTVLYSPKISERWGKWKLN